MPSVRSWFSIDRWRYKKVKDLEWPSPFPHSQSPLETLPSELFFHMAAHLNPTDRAALALGSRTMLHLLGREVLTLQGNERFSLLCRLERDGVNKADILCLGCHVFHPPRLSLSTSRYLDCTQTHDVRTWASFNLPAQFHFNFLAAVMRSHRHGWTAYTTDTLASSYRLFEQSSPVYKSLPVYTKHDTSLYPQFDSYTICKIIHGHLIVKTETSMMPCKDFEGLVDTLCIPKLLEFLQESWLRKCCCAHITWTDYYDYVFDEKAASRQGLQKLYRRIWPIPHTRSRRLSFGDDSSRVHSCMRCYTDFTFCITDLLLNNTFRRVFILTTWKDLGSANSLDDPTWRTHIFDPKIQPSPVIRSAYNANICGTFEQLSRGLNGYVNYRVPTLIDPHSMHKDS